MSLWTGISSFLPDVQFKNILNERLRFLFQKTLYKNAVNGTFTTTDGKTITVKDGQITSIV